MNQNDWGSPRHFLNRILVAILVVAVVMVAVSALFFVLRPWSGGYGPFYYPFFFPFGWIFAFFIIFWVLRWVFWPWGWGYRGRRWRYRDDSYYILRERYAKGEISREEFEHMMQTLDRHAGEHTGGS